MNLDVPVVGIPGGVDSGFFRSVMDTSFVGGLDAREITTNTEDALQIVFRHRPSVPQGKLLGLRFIALCPTGKNSTS